MFKKISLITIGFLVLMIVITSNFSGTNRNKKTVETPNPVLSEAEKAARDKSDAEALAKMRKEYDDVRKITFYYDKSSPQRTNINNIYLYISKPDNGDPTLFFRVQYGGENWLFVKNYMFKVDDKVFELTPRKVERDNYTTVWEWSDDISNPTILNIVMAVVGSKEAKIRYNGQQYYKDRIITATEKTALNNVFSAFSALTH